MRHLLFPALVLVLTLTTLGCADDFGPSGVTRIDGTAVDEVNTPVPGIYVGSVFALREAAATTLPTAGEGVLSLGAPYPNPATTPTVSKPVTIPGTVVVAGRYSVEIWGARGGGFVRIDILAQGDVAAGNRTWSWDGDDLTGFPVPNGLYVVRVLMEGGAEVAARNLLVNRSAATLIGEGRPVFQSETDGFGRYLLDDLPVGESFTRTDATGANLGSASVSDAINVVFHDPAGDFRDKQVTVFASVGAVVSHTTTLTSVISGGIYELE